RRAVAFRPHAADRAMMRRDLFWLLFQHRRLPIGIQLCPRLRWWGGRLTVRKPIAIANCVAVVVGTLEAGPFQMSPLKLGRLDTREAEVSPREISISKGRALDVAQTKACPAK